MAIELGKAYVQIIPSAEGISGAITNALGGEATTAGTEAGNAFSGSMGSAIGAGAQIAAGAVVAAGAAVAGVTSAFVSGASGVAEYGDNIDKMSQKMGISATAYQEWDAIMQHSGTSIDGMQRGLVTLSKQAEKGSDAFQKLGISQKDLQNMSQEELFAAVITGLQGMEEGTERTVIASQLLGGAAKELGPLLNTSAEETQAMRDRVHELGGVLSDEAVKAAAGYQDSLQDMTTAFDGLKNNMLAEFLPAITTVMDGLTELFSGDKDKGLGMIKEGISQFVDNLSAALPELITVGSEIVVSLAAAIVENLPQLVSVAIEALGTLGQGIMDNLPMLIDSAVSILTTLATEISTAAPEIIPEAVNAIIDTLLLLLDNVDALVDGAIALVTGLTEGIINALPILIDRMPEIITKLVEALILNAPQLVTAGPQLMISLVTGIIGAIPQLLTMGPRLVGELVKALINDAPKMIESGVAQIDKLIEGITQMIPQLLTLPGRIVNDMVSAFSSVVHLLFGVGELIGNTIHEAISKVAKQAIEWGKDLMRSFADGIGEGIEFVKDALEAVADAIAALIHFSEPDEGPLKNFHTFAPDMMDLFTKGIKDNTEELREQVKKSFDLKDLITGSFDVSPNVYPVDSDTQGGFVQNLTVNAPQELDPSEIARLTRNANREMMLQLRTT